MGDRHRPAPQQVQGAWYRLRAWIEGGFKDFKRGQWGWQHTKMLDPERAERLWLALAVSTLWVVGVGSQAEVSREALGPGAVAADPCGTADGRERNHGSTWTRTELPHARTAVCPGCCVAREAWPQAALWPEEWPAHFPPARPVSAAKQHKQRKQRERQRVKRRNYRAARRVGKGKRKKQPKNLPV